jgi:hypothetical protein
MADNDKEPPAKPSAVAKPPPPPEKPKPGRPHMVNDHDLESDKKRKTRLDE